MDRYHFSEGERKLLEGLAQPLGIFQFLNKRVVTVVLSDGFCDVFGYETREQAYFDMENNMYKYAHPDDIARIAEAAYRFATEGGTYEVIYRTRTKDRDSYHIIHAIGKHVHTDDGTRLAHVWYTDEGVYADEVVGRRTELNRAFNEALHEESLVRESNYDYLTGLPSMTYFFDLAAEAKGLIEADGEEPILLYLDLIGMKFYNTQNSYAEGDELLRAFARELKGAFGDRNCCRVGADHFAAYAVAKGLEERLARFFEACQGLNGGNSLPVRVGIYSAYMEDVPASSACDRAKLACDSLRDSYGSSYAYFEGAMLDKVERRRYVLANLDRALDEGWIQVYYQPIVRAVNGRVCDEEALSRWFDPALGMLSPADFIPALEQAGTIYKLDLYVLDQILDKMGRLREEGLTVVPHSLNLSRSDFTACDIVEEIRKRVDATDIGRDKIVVEVTESTVGDDPEFMKEQVRRFQDLGFRVWMDDFGSGYSSIDLLQGLDFDLVKFDMSFMRQLDERAGARIVLSELLKMATLLGADTLCEGVETEAQVRFLQEAGCSKLQGFYFCRPVSLEQLLERYERGIQIGFENPDESSYYETVGRVSLYDLGMVSSEDDDELRTYFDTLPMGVMEVRGERFELVRANQTYRDYLRRFFGIDLDQDGQGHTYDASQPDAAFVRMVQQCCEQGGRAFFDDILPDGSVVHSFIRHIATNPVTGTRAAAIALLSISDEKEGATYAAIARALAADYYNIYYVDLATDRYVEYSSRLGVEALAVERRGEGFFSSSRREAMERVYEGDRDRFLASFTKENVVRELDERGVFTVTYRLVDSGEPLYASMKVTRTHPGGQQIVIGISIVDAQIKQQELFDRIQRERDVLMRATALSGSFLSMYSIDPETGSYYQYSVSDEFERLGYAKEGDDFFVQAPIDAETALWPDDLPGFLAWFDKERVLAEVEEQGSSSHSYRLNMHGEPQNVTLKIAKVRESGGERLVAGVRLWQTRRA